MHRGGGALSKCRGCINDAPLPPRSARVHDVGGSPTNAKAVMHQRPPTRPVAHPPKAADLPALARALRALRDRRRARGEKK